MKHFFFLLIIINVPIRGLSQPIEILNTSVQTAQGRIDLVANEINNMESVHGIRLDLKYGELSITYQLPTLENDDFFEVIPSIKLNNKELIFLPHEEFRGDWSQPLKSGNKQLLWINLPYQYIQLKGLLEIKLTIHRWGKRKLPYDCSLGIPKFSNQQKRPYYYAAGVGVLAIGAGQIFRQQSKNIYGDNYAPSVTLTEASPFYEDANRKHHTYLILTYVGAGILASDITLFAIRYRKHQRNKKQYEQYCGDFGTIDNIPPSLKLSSGVVIGGIGLKMKMDF